MKNNIEGHWMQVRSEAIGIDIGLPFPFLEFQFYTSGKVKMRDYDTPESKFISGRYSLEDSLLILNPNDKDHKFRERLFYNEFIVEEYSDNSLIISSYTTAKVPRFRYYFIPNKLFDSFSREEIKLRYTFTQEDSIKQLKVNQEKEALKELKKNDRYLPEYPGGGNALKKYISGNLIYPPDHKNLFGVKVTFEVDIDGKLTNIQAATNSETPYSIEAIRLVKSMPNWLPAISHGVPLKRNTYVFIRFKTIR